MTYVELAIKVLHEEQKPLNADEIWQIALKKGYDKQLSSTGKTPWATIGAQIYVNMSKRKNESPFAITESRPKKFYLKSQDIQFSASADIIKPQKYSYCEKDLHPYLAYYAFAYMKCYTKTLRHEKSRKIEFGEWVHPDMVGCYFPLEDWKTEVLSLSSAIGNTSLRLYSFELKLKLGFSNLRESFFQSVSNSSWANESYLVASEIFEDDDFRDELKRLSSSFGIGIIKLDVAAPDSSEVLFPAKSREYLDWDTINKLARLNTDFADFLKRITTDTQSKEIITERYDKVYESEQLVEMINKRKT